MNMKNKNSKHLCWLLLVASLSASLSGCVGLLAGGAAGGAMVAIDRRTSGAQLDDEAIELRGANRISTASKDVGHFNIVSFNRRVLLTGEMPNAEAKNLAESNLKQVPNVREVINELVGMPNSGLVDRSFDAVTTGKVKSSLLDNAFVQVNSIKVLTERGVVYLMGLVTDLESKSAIETARRVSGVKKVVSLFEIIPETGLKK